MLQLELPLDCPPAEKMTMKTHTPPKLTVKYRKNIDGIRCAAPFIDGINIWDIPLKHWTPEVQMALKNAFQLGYQTAIHDLSRMYNPICSLMSADWEVQE